MWKIFAVSAALLVQDALAQGLFLRFGCSQLVIERVDPIVEPGVNPSAHTHQIVGGNSFNITVWSGSSPLPHLAYSHEDLPRWILLTMTRRRHRHALLVPIRKTSATTGLPACTSNPPRTVPTSWCPKWPTTASAAKASCFRRKEVLLYIICSLSAVPLRRHPSSRYVWDDG